jgi:hypothetical protein
MIAGEVMFSRAAAFLLGSFLVVGLSSCMVMRTAEKGYPPERQVKDGTAFEAELLAEGQGPGLAVSAMVVGGGATSLFGPYRLQLTAYGHEGVHQTFEIRKFRFRFTNGQSFEFGPEHISGSPVFRVGQYRGEVVAVRKATKVFAADPKKEGTVTVEADVVVRTVKGVRQETLCFVFPPMEAVKWESVNVPWEIKKAIWKEGREHPVSAWAPGASRTP